MRIKVELEIETSSYDEEMFHDAVEKVVTSKSLEEVNINADCFAKFSKLVKFDMYIFTDDETPKSQEVINNG